jgi:hypothetical protein
MSFQSCEKQDESLQVSIFPIEYCNIIGTWEIKSISGGISGDNYIPNFKYLQIKSDGDFIFLRDSYSIASGSIICKTDSEKELILSFSLDSIYSLEVINMSTFYPKHIKLVDSNQLILIDPCCDLFTYTFKKL